MQEQIGKEIGIHGPEWDSLHQGYFSDIKIAGAFIEKVKEAVTATCPEVIVDLGGGTGFLLSELFRQGLSNHIRLVNVDCSDAQLSLAHTRGIHCIRSSIADFRRSDIDQEKKRFLFIMRSVLHYFGRNGLVPLLRHIRSQAKEGELFVHQTASFENHREADCINALYEKMRTSKWYPTIQELSKCMMSAGWTISSIFPAPALALTSHDLARRYALSDGDIKDICDEITRRFGEIEKVFRLEQAGFCAYLHYRIYICAATS